MVFFYSFASHAIHIERKGTRHSPMYMYIYLYTSDSYPDFNFGLTVTILRANTAERIASQMNTHSKQPTPTRYTIIYTISTYMRFPLFIFFRRLLVAAFADIYCFQQIVGGGLGQLKLFAPNVLCLYSFIHTYIHIVYLLFSIPNFLQTHASISRMHTAANVTIDTECFRHCLQEFCVRFSVFLCVYVMIQYFMQIYAVYSRFQIHKTKKKE